MSELFFIAQQGDAVTGGMPAGMGPQIQLMVFLILGLAVYWFLILRPHNKKRKEMDRKLNSLSKGDKVVTIGGIHGKVVSTKDNLVVIRVDDKTEITFDKSAIATVGEQSKSVKESAHSDTAKTAEQENEKKETENQDEKK